MKKNNFRELMIHCKQINEDCLHCDRIEDCNDCLRVIGKVAPAKWCEGIPQTIMVQGDDKNNGNDLPGQMTVEDLQKGKE